MEVLSPMSRKRRYDKRGRPPNHSPVRIVELDEVFKSFNEAAIRIGGNRGLIELCLKGDRYTHLGYTFEYVDHNKKK